MNTKSKITKEESKTRVSAAALMRLAGLSAILAGLGFLVIGLFHPANEPASVTTPAWVIVHIFGTFMGFFGLFGMVGLHTRQAEKAGWLGLVGFILFSGWLALVMPFNFIEAAILPHLTSEFPPFVEGFLGMFTGVPSPVDLGALPTLWNISGPMLILGALLFALATFRARVLPRWAAGLLALGAVLVPVSAMLPTELQAMVIMVPMGLGLAGMGYALLTERREKTSPAMLDQKTTGPEAGKFA